MNAANDHLLLELEILRYKEFDKDILHMTGGGLRCSPVTVNVTRSHVIDVDSHDLPDNAKKIMYFTLGD